MKSGWLQKLLSTAASDTHSLWQDVLGQLAVNGDRLPLLLQDPAWPQHWRDYFLLQQNSQCLTEPGFIFATSGSSAPLPKLCLHTEATLSTAANGFLRAFPHIANCVQVLPPHHVGGFMPVVRTAMADGRCHRAHYLDADQLAAAPFPLHSAALSIVPTQLARMLQQNDVLPVLERFGLILLGGSACPSHLLDSARQLGLPVAPCYGMTETAAMVSILTPDEFHRGVHGIGRPMPHARLTLDMDNCLQIQSEANLICYLPNSDTFTRNPFPTRDLATCDAHGFWRLLGRSDRVIISGGENISLDAIEACAKDCPLVMAARAFGESDPEWGTRLILQIHLHHPIKHTTAAAQIRAHLRCHLPSFAQPKRIDFVDAQLSPLGKWTAANPSNTV